MKFKKSIASLCMGTFLTVSTVPTTVAAPSPYTQHQIEGLAKESTQRLKSSFRAFRTKGPEAFLNELHKDWKFNKEYEAQMKAVLVEAFKPLLADASALPEISSQGRIITMESSPPITLEILPDRLDPQNLEFKINGISFAWAEKGSFEQNVDVISQILERTHRPSPSAWNRVMNFFIPEANALSMGPMILIAAGIAAAIGLIIWKRRKARDEIDDYKDMQKSVKVIEKEVKALKETPPEEVEPEETDPEVEEETPEEVAPSDPH